MAGFSLGNLLYYIKMKNQDFKQGMDENKRKFQELDEKVKRNRENLKRWGAAITTISAGAIVAFTKMANTAGEYAEQLAMINKQTGLAVEDASRLGYAARQELGSIEQLTTGLTRLSRNALDASQGIGEARRAFDMLDISVVNADGSLRGADQLIYEIADKISVLGSESEKTGLVMQLLGRSGAELLPFLDLGSEGIKELGDEAERLGKVMSEKNVKDFRRYRDTVDAVTAGLEGLKMKIANDVLPNLQWLIDKAKDAVEWFNALPEPIRKTVTQFGFFSAAAGLIVGPLMMIVGFLPQIAGGLTLISKSFTPFLLGGAIIAGITFLVNKFIEWRENVNLLKEDLKSLDEESAAKRLGLLEQEKEELISKAKVLSWGSGRTWQEWITENAQEEWDAINSQINATKSYITELEEQKRLEKDIAETKQKQLAVGIKAEQQVSELISKYSSPERRYEDYPADVATYLSGIAPSSTSFAIEQLEDLKKLFEGEASKWGHKLDFDWSGLSEEKRLELIEKINNQIMRLEHQRATEVSALDEQLAQKKMEYGMDEYEYKINLLEEEKKAVVDAYYSQLGSTKEWLDKKLEVEELYDGMIDDIREERNEKDRAAMLELITGFAKATAEGRFRELERRAAVNAEFMSEYERATMEQYEYEKLLLDRMYEYYRKYILDKKKLDEWYNAEKKKLDDRYAEEEKAAMEQWLIDVGIKADLASDLFSTLRNGLVDGFTAAIKKGEDFLDTLKNIADQIAEMIVRKGIIEPAVDWLLALPFDGVAHGGGLVTVNGVESIASYHTGGLSGRNPLQPDEKLIKTKVGELILNEDQQKGLVSQQNAGPTIINHITAMDSQDVARALTKDGGAAVAAALGLDYSRNGSTRKIIKGGS